MFWWYHLFIHFPPDIHSPILFSICLSQQAATCLSPLYLSDFGFLCSNTVSPPSQLPHSQTALLAPIARLPSEDTFTSMVLYTTTTPGSRVFSLSGSPSRASVLILTSSPRLQTWKYWQAARDLSSLSSWKITVWSQSCFFSKEKDYFIPPGLYISSIRQGKISSALWGWGEGYMKEQTK